MHMPLSITHAPREALFQPCALLQPALAQKRHAQQHCEHGGGEGGDEGRAAAVVGEAAPRLFAASARVYSLSASCVRMQKAEYSAQPAATANTLRHSALPNTFRRIFRSDMPITRRIV